MAYRHHADGTIAPDPDARETAAFETAWAELAPILTALPPAHLNITRRIGRILFNDGIRCGMDVGAGIALSVLRESSVATKDSEADAEERTAIPPAIIVNFNGRRISASRTDTLADIVRMLLGDLPDGADVTLQIESAGSIKQAPVAEVQHHVTVISGGANYYCTLYANDIVEVADEMGDLLASVQWNTKTGDHDHAHFASCGHRINYDELNSILAHASDAWRKHRR